ncbi:SdrD B-like domain-containing protein [Jannaschia seohaensis]|uniref:Cna protein B-type domain-containing protein n=1 Tax=Jannaschia seohaensis TaxID=475081 RepID=A0A2Y9A1W0_9RHOB|nr:SdrD B-like domain-containing protein [Jannaschia seohaensis]PWJ22253.1 SdrD B-like protein [Jannaschia seohaensis]SSA38531.1 Cna protein B-type domain-containing protein [Jannaschia seohaensis]
MDTITFTLDGASTGNPVGTEITLTELANGEILITFKQFATNGTDLGDYQAFWFDVADESLIGSLTITPEATSAGFTPDISVPEYGDDSVTDLTDGNISANLSGVGYGDDDGFDYGFLVTSAPPDSEGEDDYGTLSFVISSSDRALTLEDFADSYFGVRIRSVGPDTDGDGDGDGGGSFKQIGVSPDIITISGTKYEDITGDGIDGNDGTLDGVTIFIDEDGDGTLDAGERSTVTDANGDWSFTLTDEDYDFSDPNVRVFEMLPSGYTQTVGGAGYDLDGTDQSGLNFANFAFFSISGAKFTDLDGDGNYTDGVAGWSMTLWKDDGDGVFEANEDSNEGSTLTVAGGAYSFENLGPGTYFVTEEDKDGWEVVTGPVSGPIAATSGGSSTGNDFENFQEFSISGTKYEDIDGDGLGGDDVAWDASALGAVTIYVELDDVEGLTAGDVSADVGNDGTWSISGLGLDAVGAEIFEILPDGTTETTGLVNTVDNPGSGGTDSGNDFANFRDFSISGAKFTDLDGDGNYTDGVAGWSMTLWKDDGDGVFEANEDSNEGSTLTVAGGAYSFENLGPGTYFVTEEDKDGWEVVTGPVSGPIAATSGGSSTGNDFENFQEFSISGTKYEDIDGDGLGGDDVAWDASALGAVTIYVELDDVEGLTAGDVSADVGNDGTWSISGLGLDAVGAEIFEILPDGTTETTGLVNTVDNPGSGGTDSGNDFANFRDFSISGTKYDDVNGDGLGGGDDVAWDASALGAVTIFIDVNGNGDNDDGYSTTVGNDGSWSISGVGLDAVDADILEILPDGTTETTGTVNTVDNPGSGGEDTNNDFANFRLLNLSGIKFTDRYGNGDMADWTAGSSQSFSIGIYAWDDASGNGDGLVDAGELTAVAEASTDPANGNWSAAVGPLDAGEKYYVQEVSEGGWLQTGGLDGYVIDPTSGNDNANLDFANFELFDISGHKWNDLNGDGVWNGGEPGILGWTITLTDEDGNTVSQQTGADGSYSFTDLMPGTYTIEEVQREGWTNTYDGSTTVVGESGASFEGRFEQTEVLNFGNWDGDAPGVRTPGYWGSKWGSQFWDAIQDNERHADKENTPDGELLSEEILVLGVPGGTQIALELELAKLLIDANNKQVQDGNWLLGRDAVATTLNFLAGNPGGSLTNDDDPNDPCDDEPVDILDEAVTWLFNNLDAVGAFDGDGIVSKQDAKALMHAPVAMSSDEWQAPQPGIEHAAAQLHDWLDEYNNTGGLTCNGITTTWATDADSFDFV